MAKCPVCESEIIEVRPWLRCSECGAELHLKISKTGRVKKIVVHSFDNFESVGDELLQLDLKSKVI
jgi:hypothetical protein